MCVCVCVCVFVHVCVLHDARQSGVAVFDAVALGVRGLVRWLCVGSVCVWVFCLLSMYALRNAHIFLATDKVYVWSLSFITTHTHKRTRKYNITLLLQQT